MSEITKHRPTFMDAMVVRVTVSMPWAPGKEYCAESLVALQACRDSFAPLPRDREVMFGGRSAAQARMMQENRQLLVRQLGADLAEIILRAVEGRDPQHGYTPEEWAAIQSKSKR